jgi:hypothetical protein
VHACSEYIPAAGFRLTPPYGQLAFFASSFVFLLMPDRLRSRDAEACPPGVSLGLLDGETFTIGDGVGGTTIFEFDADASVTPGASAISFEAGASAAMIKNRIVVPVNNSALSVTASSGRYGAASTCASRSKRAIRSGSPAKSGGRILMATSRFSLASRAR